MNVAEDYIKAEEALEKRVREIAQVAIDLDDELSNIELNALQDDPKINFEGVYDGCISVEFISYVSYEDWDYEHAQKFPISLFEGEFNLEDVKAFWIADNEAKQKLLLFNNIEDMYYNLQYDPLMVKGVLDIIKEEPKEGLPFPKRVELLKQLSDKLYEDSLNEPNR